MRNRGRRARAPPPAPGAVRGPGAATRGEQRATRLAAPDGGGPMTRSLHAMLSRIRPPTSGTGLYVQVQQFYARQMRLLDAHDIDAHAQTFTDDATFEHIPGPGVAVGRTAIAEVLRRWDTGSGDPVQRRHW